MRSSDANAEEVFSKIAEAAKKIHGFGSRMPISDQLSRALCGHLSKLIAQGVRDHQSLLDEGVAFLRRQETKRMK